MRYVGGRSHAPLLELDLGGRQRVEQAQALAEKEGGDVQRHLIDGTCLQVPANGVGPSRDAHILVGGRSFGFIQGTLDPVGDEVKRRAALPMPRIASLVSEDEYRRAKWRLFRPADLALVEHAPAH